MVCCFPVTIKAGPEKYPRIAQPEEEHGSGPEKRHIDELGHGNELTYYTLFHICIITIMPPGPALQEVLERYRKGEISLESAAEAIEGLRLDRIGNFACIDLGRDVRCGMPEAVLAEGKDSGHLAKIAIRHAQEAGRCVVTRIAGDQVVPVQDAAIAQGMKAEYHEAGRLLIVAKSPAQKKTGGIVAVITAGTSDIRVAEEARIIAEEMGCEVRTAYDVGAAGIHRLFPALKPLLAAHVFVVCAGREGTLPSVVAGLVDRPVIGVPVSVGYGYMGGGKAALASMLQSCSVLSVVNIDAGFTAGAFAAQIANQGMQR
jgi:pyridinium-3,5-biscarboxylic acid mononucleotide synthase